MPLVSRLIIFPWQLFTTPGTAGFLCGNPLRSDGYGSRRQGERSGAQPAATLAVKSIPGLLVSQGKVYQGIRRPDRSLRKPGRPSQRGLCPKAAGGGLSAGVCMLGTGLSEARCLGRVRGVGVGGGAYSLRRVPGTRRQRVAEGHTQTRRKRLRDQVSALGWGVVCCFCACD